MELRQLRYLLAVAEKGHMGRAADAVHISQPGLSQQLRKLEDELGVTLLERHAKGVRLSIAGIALLPFFRNALRQVQDAKAALADLNQRIQGSITVGSLQAINVGLLPLAIARLITAHPALHVQAQELPALDIEIGVQNGELDLGIGFLPVHPNSEGFETEPLFDEHLVLVVSSGHPLAAETRLPVAELRDLPLALLPERFQIRRILNNVAAAQALPLWVTVELDTVHSLLAVVSASELGTVLPAMAVTKASEDIRSIPLVDPTPSCSVGLIWRRGSFHNSASRALANELRSLINEYDTDVEN